MHFSAESFQSPICFIAGCPLSRRVSPMDERKCVPMIALPMCKCETIKSVEISGVPMKCPTGRKEYKKLEIPTDCKCTC